MSLGTSVPTIVRLFRWLRCKDLASYRSSGHAGFVLVFPSLDAFFSLMITSQGSVSLGTSGYRCYCRRYGPLVTFQTWSLLGTTFHKTVLSKTDDAPLLTFLCFLLLRFSDHSSDVVSRSTFYFYRVPFVVSHDSLRF